ncbi:hypothetical protein [uncultured Psychrobacter sp.]|uniref:hypothetical protein n=1 Tax=uncultured Psychrobacter sp. TaxID=259303 RepID=UPI0034585416
MSEHVVENNPKKELLFALGGVALFLGIVLLIGISAFLRPAGEHITAETTEASAAAEQAEDIVAEDVVVEDAAPATDSADTTSDTTEAATVGATSTDTAADATVTPAPETGDAVVATGSATATADGTVDQAAVDETELSAEQADGDAEGTEPATTQ